MAQIKKCVFVGDHHTGKTLICYIGLNREFPRFVLCPSRSNTTVFHFDVVVSFGTEVASHQWQTLFVSPLLWMGPMSLSTCGIQVCMISTTVSVRCAIQGLMSLSSVIQSSCARHVCLCFSHHFLLDSPFTMPDVCASVDSQQREHALGPRAAQTCPQRTNCSRWHQ